MPTADRFGGGAGLSWRAFPPFASRPGCALLACAVLALALCSQTAMADTYRCQGAGGETVYTGNRAGYTHCVTLHLDTRRRADAQRHAQAIIKSAVKPAVKPAARSATALPAKAASASASVATPAIVGSASPPPKASAAPKRSSRAVVLRGAVYRVVRTDGTVEYTNVKPRHQHGHKVTQLFTYIDVCAACGLHSKVNWNTVPLRLTAYDQAVQSAATAYGVQPAFLRAIIHAESAFDPEALSHKGAQGLMQLMPGTASDMGVTDAFNATDNIRGGARYLAKLLKEFHGDRQMAAAAYNAGPDAVRKYSGVPPYAETKVYVQRVGTLYRRYSEALAQSVLADSGS